MQLWKINFHYFVPHSVLPYSLVPFFMIMLLVHRFMATQAIDAKSLQSNEIDLANNLPGFFSMKLASTCSISVSCTSYNCSKFKSFSRCSPIALSWLTFRTLVLGNEKRKFSFRIFIAKIRNKLNRF